MKNRNSNIELLRIISIIMIIMSHYSVHSGINISSFPIGINRFLMEGITLGNIGVIIFVVITGYFSIKKENPFSMKKLLNLYFQILFYSVTIYALSLIIGTEKINVKSLAMNLFPIVFNAYWFATVFILLYIFTPFINKFINKLTKNEYKYFLLLSFMVFFVLKTICLQKLYFNELLQFFFFYCIGAYISKYESYIFFNKKIIISILSISLICVMLSIIVFDYLGNFNTLFSKHSTYLLSRTSFFSMLIAVCIFCLFLQKKAFTSKAINKISSGVFAIYLISDNNYVREVLWTDILNVEKYFHSWVLPFHILYSLITVFSVCIVIELIRQLLFKRINDFITEYIANKLNKYIDKLKNREITE